MATRCCCRRNIEPRYGIVDAAGRLHGARAVPPKQGSARPTKKPARISEPGLFSVLRGAAGQVHLYFRARLLDAVFAPGPETIEARLFREDEIPWDELAFRTVRENPKYFADRREGR